MTEPQTAAANLQDAPATEIDLHLERHFAARPERVFQALTDPAELVRWWGPEGFTVPECELDVRPVSRLEKRHAHGARRARP